MSRVMRALSAGLLLSLLAVLANPTVMAHENPKPQHGGIAVASGDLTVELVVMGDQAEVFVLDNDQEVDSSRYAGKLLVNASGKVSERSLQPAGGHRFRASGVQIAPGATVIVQIAKAGQPAQYSLFPIK